MLRLSENQLTDIKSRRTQNGESTYPHYDLPRFIIDSLELAQLHKLSSPLITTLNIGLSALQANNIKRKPYESVEQAISLVWLACNNTEAFDLTTATPMGGYRPKGAGGQMKGEGAKPGYPDLLMDMPMNGYHGLRIEMKKFCKSAKASAVQVKWLSTLNRYGYRAVLCRGHQAAIYEIAAYLGMNAPYKRSHLPGWAIEIF